MGRIIVMFYILVSVLVFSPGYAKGSQCQKSLQSESSQSQASIPKISRAVRSRVDALEKAFSQITTPDQLRLFLADSKEGGQDGRRQIFMLEVYGQVLRHYRKGEGIRNRFRSFIDDNFKVLEDAMGEYGEWLELQETVASFQIEPRFEAYLAAKRVESLTGLFQKLKKDHWIGDNTQKFKDLRVELSEMPWPETVERDHKLFYRALRDTLEYYQQKMVKEIKPVLFADRWTYDENMEEGLHETRRILRWMMLTMQTIPEAFSYSKPLDAETLQLPEPALMMAKKDLLKHQKRNSDMILIGGKRPGTLVVSPEATFYLSALVDKLGKLKNKSELFFALQREVRAYLRVHKSLGTLDAHATGEQIQSFLIESSDTPESLANFKEVFQAGDSNTFLRVREQTLNMLNPFWSVKPILDFHEAADKAREYWDDQE